VKNSEYKCFYFKQGNYKEIDIKSPDRLNHHLEKLINETDDVLKLLVSEERINDIKKEESGIEIIYTEKTSIKSSKLGQFLIDRILIPFEGTFVGDSSSPVVTIFIGDSTYISGPLRNSNGLNDLDSLKQIVVE
jgi:hypothetical protein